MIAVLSTGDIVSGHYVGRQCIFSHPEKPALGRGPRLLSGAWSGRHVQAVHGPEDLRLTQVADILTAALGRPIRAETISDDAQRRSLRSACLGEKQVEGMVGMAAVMRPDFVPENERSIITTTPTTLAAWAHAHLHPLLRASSAT